MFTSQSTQLPAAITPFFGRDEEHAALVSLLRDPACKLITVSGIGGVGKTRLAIEAAAAIAPPTPDSPFPDGVVFVSVASLMPTQALHEQLATTIATAIGLPIGGPEAAIMQLGHLLREKTLLIVLDNFEQLLEGTLVLSQMLEASPGLKLLITSRERLKLRGEQVIVLEGLACPNEHELAPESTEAVRFFLALAQMHAPQAPQTPADLAAVAHICTMLEGLPLGIELAASWTTMLSPGEIANELAGSFDFLAGSLADLPERQHSLRAVFLSSWRMLTGEEQAALRQLAALPGSFTREAAQAVAGATLPLLSSLVNKSMVRRAPPDARNTTRFLLPGPLRPYITEALHEANEYAAAADRQSLFYLQLLAANTANLRGPDQPAALGMLSREIAQIRAAWQHASNHAQVEQLHDAIDGMFHVYDMRSWFGEGAQAFGTARAALETATEAGSAARLVWARLLAREAWFTFHCGMQQQAKTQLERSLAALRAVSAPVTELTWAMNYLAAVCSYLGDYVTTVALCSESLALSSGKEYPHVRVVALSVLCQTAYDQGDYATARRWGEQSLVLEQQIGSPWSTAFSLTNLGKVAAALGEHTNAQNLFARSLQIRQELGDIRGTAICLNRLGDTTLALGDLPGAVQQYTAALEQFRAIGNQWGIAAALLQLGRFATRYGTRAAAARLLHEALELALVTGSVPQGTAVLEAFVELLRHSGESTVAADASRLLREWNQQPEQYQAAAARLLAWSAGSAPAALTLEEAMAATHVAAKQPPVSLIQSAPTNSAGLTAREIDVLRLVAQGMTDAQVADQLVLSPRTVQSHLASIYSKLAINSRTAATRFALENGLK